MTRVQLSKRLSALALTGFVLTTGCEGRRASTVQPGGHAGGAAVEDASVPSPEGGFPAMMDASVMDASWRGEVPLVCDGTSRVRLRYRIVDSPDRFPPGGFLPYQNGSAYWLITGECDFYVQHTLGRVSSGQLASDEAQELGRAVHFGNDFSEGSYGPSSPVSHPSTLLLEREESTIMCTGECGDAPPGVQDAMSNAARLIAQLRGRAQSWTGPMRVTSICKPIPLQTLLERFAIDWPLETALAGLSGSLDDWYDGQYNGALVDDPDDAAKLRALPPPPEGYDFWPVRNGDRSYCELRARDAIPLEDERGEIRRIWDGSDP